MSRSDLWLVASEKGKCLNDRQCLSEEKNGTRDEGVGKKKCLSV